MSRLNAIEQGSTAMPTWAPWVPTGRPKWSARVAAVGQSHLPTYEARRDYFAALVEEALA